MLKQLKTEDFAPNVPLSENMPRVEATDVLLWRLRLFCSNCRVHCYSPDMRQQIKKVMRFSGPQ